MRALSLMAMVCVASIALQGCKARKHEPVPGPQVCAVTHAIVAADPLFLARPCYNPRR